VMQSEYNMRESVPGTASHASLLKTK